MRFARIAGALTLSKRGERERSLLLEYRKWIESIAAFGLGLAIWQLPPAPSMEQQGMHFLATLCVAVVLWVFEVFDEYIVALLLLVSWRLFNIVPTEIALSGFSTGSWFFLVGALGTGAAVASSGLPRRLAYGILRRIPLYKFGTLTLVLSATGLLITPAMPTGKVRATLMVPIASAISEAACFKPRSNGSAVLALSAYVGFAQMSFVFLTGGAHNLAGWSLLPESAKMDFGWSMWTLAALPAGIFTFCFLLFVARFSMPLTSEDRAGISAKQNEGRKTEAFGALTHSEWLSIAVLALVLLGWLGKPLHGIGETWIAMAGLLVFLIAGSLDKNGLVNKIDWGFLLFFGISYGLARISSELKVDRWLIGIMEPVLVAFSHNPLTFLMVVVLLVYVVNLFLKKAPAVILLMFALMPWAQNLGIHPGVLLLTIILAIQGFILPYQDGPYQLAYFSSDRKMFSHSQGQILLLAKFAASFIAVAISVPYWRTLGLIQ